MILVSNLSATILCPFQLIADMSAQLELMILAKEHTCAQSKELISERDSEMALKNLQTIQSCLFQEVCPLNVPTDWVNLDDSTGDPGALRAYEFNDLLLSVLKALGQPPIELHVHAAAKNLGEDTLLSLIILAETYPSLQVTFYSDDPEAQDFLARLAILTKCSNLKTTCGRMDQLNSQSSLFQAMQQVDENRSKRLQEKGYLFHGPDKQTLNISTANIGPLFGYAWACLKAGAYRLSCDLLENTLKDFELTPPVKEEIFLQLQAIRFLSHLHHVVTDANFPQTFECIEDERVRYLYFIKAFSATMTRQLSMAEKCFEKACIHTEMERSDEDSIYQLNLYALFLVLHGKQEEAFTLEKQLIEHLNSHLPKATVLNHVIRMNIARLLKKDKRYEPAAVAYDEAYAQLNGGGFTLFDRMNYEMDKAILHEACNETEKALWGWLKVTLYWFACPNPYALPVRPRLVLCKEKVVDTVVPLDKNKVHEFLLNKLRTFSSSLNLGSSYDNNGTEEGGVYQFVADSQLFKEEKAYHVIDDMVLYTLNHHLDKSSKTNDSAEHALRRMASQILKKRFDLGQQVKSVAIQTLFDLPVPETSKEAIAQASITSCHTCHFQNEMMVLNTLSSITPDTSIFIQLPPILDKIEHTSSGTMLTYRRSYLDKSVTNPEIIAIIKQLQSGEMLLVEDLRKHSMDLFWQLLHDKIIVLSTQEKSMDQSDNLHAEQIMKSKKPESITSLRKMGHSTSSNTTESAD